MQSICFVFSSLGMQRRLVQTKVCNELLLFCQKESHLQTFTSSSLKMFFFRRVRYWNKFLRLFFSPYNNYKVLFFIWFFFNHHDIPLFEASVLYYFISWMHVCLFKLDFRKKNLSLSRRMFLYLWEQISFPLWMHIFLYKLDFWRK